MVGVPEVVVLLTGLGSLGVDVSDPRVCKASLS